MAPLDALLWVGVAIFAATGAVTLCALVGWCQLGGVDTHDHRYYLRRLFAVLIVEIIGASVIAFSANIAGGREITEAGAEQAQATSETIAELQDSLLFATHRALAMRDTVVEISRPPDSIPPDSDPTESEPTEWVRDTVRVDSLPMLDTFRLTEREEAPLGTIDRPLYSTPDRPQTVVVQIPEGWQYVNHELVIHEGRREWAQVRELRGAAGEVVAIRAELRPREAGALSVFRIPRPMIGRLLVTIARR